MKENLNCRRNWKLYNILLIIVIICLAVPTKFWEKGPDIDCGFVYVLNKYARQLTFGKDVVFTFGPFGFLLHCMDEGNKILMTLTAWALLLAGHAFLLYQYLFRLKEGSKDRKAVVLGMVLFVLSESAFGTEYYWCYVALFALLLALNGFRRDVYIFDILLIVSLYIKFNLFMMIFGFLVLYLMFGYFYDKELYKYCSLRMLAGLVVSPLVYFVLNGFSPDNLVNFWNYIRGSVEISAGNCVAMGPVGNDGALIWALIGAAAFLLCIILGWKSGMYNFMVMAFVGECLFMCYKHTMVLHRNGMGSMMFFLSLLPLFIRWDCLFESLGGRKRQLYVTLLSVLIMITVVESGLKDMNLVNRIRNNVYELPNTIKTIREQDPSELDPLPGGVLAEIGTSSMTVYPHRISYCMSYDFNYVPLFTIQAYSAFTPYLDQMTAEMFWDDDAPAYILFATTTLGDRWPLIECPQTWEAIRYNYDVCIQEGVLLLKHKEREVVKRPEYHFLKASDYARDDVIDLDGADYLIMNADMNLLGKLTKILYKIPPVNLHVYYTDGREETHRVLLDMFSGGVELGRLSSTGEGVIDIMNGEADSWNVEKIVLEGEGLKYYKKEMQVEFYTSETR